MTAHTLAKQLLAGPDVPVCVMVDATEWTEIEKFRADNGPFASIEAMKVYKKQFRGGIRAGATYDDLGFADGPHIELL